MKLEVSKKNASAVYVFFKQQIEKKQVLKFEKRFETDGNFVRKINLKIKDEKLVARLLAYRDIARIRNFNGIYRCCFETVVSLPMILGIYYGAMQPSPLYYYNSDTKIFYAKYYNTVCYKYEERKMHAYEIENFKSVLHMIFPALNINHSKLGV